jgi:hypothetical protein
MNDSRGVMEQRLGPLGEARLGLREFGKGVHWEPTLVSTCMDRRHVWPSSLAADNQWHKILSKRLWIPTYFGQQECFRVRG